MPSLLWVTLMIWFVVGDTIDAKSQTIPVKEGTLTGRTGLFEENDVINASKHVDMFLVCTKYKSFS